MSEFDQFRDTYAEDIEDAIRFSGKPLAFFTKAKADLIIPLLAEHMPDGPLDILDIGCGHGLVHPYLLEARPSLRLRGVDNAADVIDEARKMNPNVLFDAYNGHRLPYDDRSFDVAFTICVMHHVLPEQRRNFMQEMARVLRPGGLCVVIEHNPLNPLTQYIVRTCPIDENAVILWPREVRKLAMNAGLHSVTT
ncbi:class I SAM-dependent methyltransferase, partial [Planktotalea sp.]